MSREDAREIISALIREHRRLLEALGSSSPGKPGYISLINAQAKLLRSLLDYLKLFGEDEGLDLAQLLSKAAEKRGLMSVKGAVIPEELVGDALELALRSSELARKILVLGRGEA